MPSLGKTDGDKQRNSDDTKKNNVEDPELDPEYFNVPEPVSNQFRVLEITSLFYNQFTIRKVAFALRGVLIECSQQYDEIDIHWYQGNCY